MNLLNYLTGLFRGHNANGELGKVRESARQDAQLMCGTYVREFEAEAASIFMGSQQKLLGLDEAETVIDVSYSEPIDYSTWKRPDLMREARSQGITVRRTDTVKSLADALLARKGNGTLAKQ